MAKAADPSVQEGQDVIQVAQGFGILNYTNFEHKLANLSGFEGFSPRYTLIGKLRNRDTVD